MEIDFQDALYHKRDEIHAQVRKQYYRKKLNRNRTRLLLQQNSMLDQAESIPVSPSSPTSSKASSSDSIPLRVQELKTWISASQFGDALLKNRILQKLTLMLPSLPYNRYTLDTCIRLVYNLICMKPAASYIFIALKDILENIIDRLISECAEGEPIAEAIYQMFLDMLQEVFNVNCKYKPESVHRLLQFMIRRLRSTGFSQGLIVKSANILDHLFTISYDSEDQSDASAIIKYWYWEFGKTLTQLLPQCCRTQTVHEFLLSPLCNMTIKDESDSELADTLIERGLGETLIQIFLSPASSDSVKHYCIILLYNVLTTGDQSHILRLCKGGMLKVIEYCLSYEINLDTLQLCVKLVLKLINFVKKEMTGQIQKDSYLAIVDAVRSSVGGLMQSSDTYVRETAQQIAQTIMMDLLGNQSHPYDPNYSNTTMSIQS